MPFSRSECALVYMLHKDANNTMDYRERYNEAQEPNYPGFAALRKHNDDETNHQ